MDSVTFTRNYAGIRVLLQQTADAVESALGVLHSCFPPPKFLKLAGRIPAYRHDQKNDLLMSYLKCVRCVSMLRAGVLLLDHGFYSEVGILCRCISESFEDVVFLATPLGEGGAYSKQQNQLVEEFFQEEFDDPSKPVTSQASRDRVSRDQVLAGIARMSGNPVNPSDAKTLTRALHMGYSGYVHGAYPHIMETFSAPPDENGECDFSKGRYHMAGLPPDQQLWGMVEAFASRALQVVMAVQTVAKRVGNTDVVERLAGLERALLEATGSVIKDLNQAVKDVKTGKPLNR